MQPSQEFIEQVLKESNFKSLEEATHHYQRIYFGRRYVGSTFGELEIPDWVGEKIIEFMKNPKNMLIYHGKSGCGKTKMMACLMEWAFLKFKSFRVHREIDLLSRLRASFGDDYSDYSKHLESLTDDDLIILDDVGSGINPEKITYKDLEWRREILFNFLDNRYNSMLPTIITSNFTKEQFEEVYSERIASRIFASENSFIRLFEEGIDHRQLGR